MVFHAYFDAGEPKFPVQSLGFVLDFGIRFVSMTAYRFVIYITEC